MNVFSSVILFIISIQRGYSIRCYECNSYNNSMCLDPTLYDKETVGKYLMVSNCNQGIFRADQQKFFCRKIVQTILRKNHDSEVRVTRGCGWVRHHKDCYKADNEDHLETVCQCFSDNCNAAADVRYCLATILTSIAIFALKL